MGNLFIYAKSKYQINLFTCINNITSFILKRNLFRSLLKFDKIDSDLTLLGREFQFLVAK